MKEIPVSVCISAHNAGKFLPRCLDSVVKQTLSPIEIVLVNNGSTDNSLEIMEDYKRKYPNIDILIISQEDKGLAQGRQAGVAHARGEYIAFLDADDYVLSNAYERMYHAAMNSDADIVEAQSAINGRGVVLSSVYTNLQNADNVLRDLLTSVNHIPLPLWLRLYKKKLFDNEVFPCFYTNYEDTFALPCLLYRAKKIYFMKEVLHVFYRDNENSITFSAWKKKDPIKELNALKTLLRVVRHFWNFVGEDDILKNYHEEIKAYTALRIALFICTDSIDLSYSKRIDVIRDEFAYFKTARTHDIELFVKENIVPSRKLYRCIKIIGLKLTSLIFRLTERYRNKSKRS